MTLLATHRGPGAPELTIVPSGARAVLEPGARTTGARTSDRLVLLAASTVATAGASLALGASTVQVAALALAWSGWSALRTEGVVPSVAHVVREVLAPALAAVAVLVAVLDLGRDLLWQSWAGVLGGAAVMVLARHRRLARNPVVVVVGDDTAVERAVDTWPGRGPALGGAVVLDGLERDGARIRFDGVLEAVRRTGADSVLCLSGDALSGDDLQRLSWALEETSASLVVQTALSSVGAHRVRLSRLGASTVAQVRPSRPPRAVRAAKSAFDRVAAAAMLTLLSPLLLAIVVAVRLDSAGPALFRQERVGHRGKTFTMLKFRSMAVDAEARLTELHELDEGNGVLFKIRADPRVTKVGKLLRRTSLDELPQLVNVVRGEMSLVGPRPALPEEVAGYDARALRRLAARPGLTGLWQVSGRSDLGWEESLALDLDYTDNITMSRDLLICLSTLQAVTSGRGAY